MHGIGSATRLWLHRTNEGAIAMAQTTNILVTVYISSFNYGKYLDIAIRSVESQSFKAWELVLIDDGSTDNTAEIINEARRRIRSDRLVTVKNAKPLGLQKVANYCLGIAKGKYILRVDADDWLDESALLILVDQLESDDKAVVSFGNYVYVDGAGSPLAVESRDMYKDSGSLLFTPAHGACSLFRVKTLKSIGGYSETLDAQDGWDIWHRIASKTTVRQVSSVIFYYRQHPGTISKDRSRLISSRNKIFARLSEKNRGSYKPTVLAVVPAKYDYSNWKKVPFSSLNNKNLIEYTLDAALKSMEVTDIMITSDTAEVIDHSRSYCKGESKRIHCAIRSSTNYVNPSEILLFACEEYETIMGRFPDIVVFLSIHAPFRDDGLIDSSIQQLCHCKSDSIVSVIPLTEPVFGLGSDGLDLLNPGRFKGFAQDTETYLVFTGSLICLWSHNLLDEKGGILGKEIAYLEEEQHPVGQVKSKQGLTLANRILS